ncbi:MAG TPA: protein-L-isoaspartate(D-aspartate) O-methyltransferase [Myxococcaceae bacterium]|nr:protein-L-isoaspartate(D-aspartate) O-methyltransferase [Myxococcaceae bacterium]
MELRGDVELAEQLGRKGIRDRRVLEAIASLHRSEFIPERLGWHATEDRPLPIGHGQTISQPFIVAFMTEALGLLGGERVLEIGTGSGYQTAVLARMGVDVYSVEIVPELAREARERFARFEAPGRILLREANGWLGWPEAAPFDAVILTAAPPRLPDELVAQLRPGGVLVAPVGSQAWTQDLVRVRKGEDGALRTESLLSVTFVPMTGEASAPGFG